MLLANVFAFSSYMHNLRGNIFQYMILIDKRNICLCDHGHDLFLMSSTWLNRCVRLSQGLSLSKRGKLLILLVITNRLLMCKSFDNDNAWKQIHNAWWFNTQHLTTSKDELKSRTKTIQVKKSIKKSRRRRGPNHCKHF